MSYLLDTNIVSDVARRADAGLLQWMHLQSPLDLYLSVLSLGEIQQGIDLLDRKDARRAKLADWLRHDLPAQFEERLLAVTASVALAYGELAAQGKRAGRHLAGA